MTNVVKMIGEVIWGEIRANVKVRIKRSVIDADLNLNRRYLVEQIESE